MGRGERGGVSEQGDKDETRTPLSILEPLVKVLGPIGFDPCSHPGSIVPAQQHVLLPKYREESAYVPGGDLRRIIWGDGLLLDWSGRGLVFCNMPYSDIGPWGAKRHEGDETVFFSPVRTANRWWRATFDDADAVCFLYDRVKHVGMKTHADFHQCLPYYGPRVREFFEGLHEQLGRVYVHERHWSWR